MPEKIFVGLDDGLIQKLEYFLILDFDPKDLEKIQSYGMRDFKAKWNAKYRTRFDVKEIKLDPEYPGKYMLIRGEAKTGESFNKLGTDRFWGHHIHIENIHNIEAYRYDIVLPPVPGEDPGASTPEEQQKNLVFLVLLVAAIFLGVWFFVFRRKK